jgi:hypothetical protein
MDCRVSVVNAARSLTPSSAWALAKGGRRAAPEQDLSTQTPSRN